MAGRTRSPGALIIHREDWVILLVCLIGAGVALNDAAKNGDASPFGGGLWGFVKSAFNGGCLRHPIRCARDMWERFEARALFELALLAVAATVILRRFEPKLAGIPYGILMAAIAAVTFTGKLDGVLRAFDPRPLLNRLERPPPPAPPAPPPGPPTYMQRTCYAPEDVCSGARGGVAAIQAGHSSTMCRYASCRCRDGSAWSLIVPWGSAPIPLAPAANCRDAQALTLNEGGPWKIWRSQNGHGCGYVESRRGNVYNLQTGQMVSRADFSRRVGSELLRTVWEAITEPARGGGTLTRKGGK